MKLLLITLAFLLTPISPAVQLFVSTGAPATYADRYDVLVTIYSNRIVIRKAESGDGDGGWGDILQEIDATLVYIESYKHGRLIGYQPVCADSSPDLNGDGVVDLRDFKIFQNSFGAEE